MEFHEDDSYFKQPLLLGECLDFAGTQPHYYDNLHGLPDQKSTSRSARIPSDTNQSSVPAFNLGLSTNLFQRNGYRDTWHYHQALEAQEQDLGSDFQPSPAQCLNRELTSLSQPVFEESYRMADSSDVEPYKEDTTSSSTSPRIGSSPALDVWPFAPEESIPAFRSEIGLLTKDSQDEEEASGDKPYARLIHEALMQAPGHRMMLREIYDWFAQNTNKPSESGTNGWQNSIRHNLSMNQAFENDRTDPVNPGHQARKANSVWILTEDAVRHGVQSTTRYRKHGSNKKTNRTRIPAPLRQRSGAKGGRAARRAAKLRREEQMHRQGTDSVPQGLRLPDFYGMQGIDRTSQDADHFSFASPLTPENEPAFAFSQVSDGGAYYYHLPDYYDFKPESLAGQAEPPCEGELQPKAENCIKETLAYPYTSSTQNVAKSIPSGCAQKYMDCER